LIFTGHHVESLLRPDRFGIEANSRWLFRRARMTLRSSRLIKGDSGPGLICPVDRQSPVICSTWNTSLQRIWAVIICQIWMSWSHYYG
jgi:hypothetical protein